jgi:hypothetical protein
MCVENRVNWEGICKEASGVYVKALARYSPREAEVKDVTVLIMEVCVCVDQRPNFTQS